MSTSNTKSLAVCLAIATLTIPANAHAYIDPGTGSVIIQAIIGGVVAVGFFLKTNWLRVKAFFKKLFGRGDSSGRQKKK